ncbi:MAG: protein kinase [Dysgonamonadaceae bacterium]|jgi:serine/threonine protein kinase|nr:protein kinase [Dysgonamonadaceae bacterium]
MENSSALLPGTILQQGKYRIDAHLGGGGFGITYRATWISYVTTNLGLKKSGEQRVAIKEFFYKEFCYRKDATTTISFTNTDKSEDFARLRKKLISEAHILNSLEHPHIVRVIDVFEENNTAYIVMDYIDGINLEDKGKCSVEDSVKYISQIASALELVHQKKILHLDITPSNILIDNSTDKALLIDFGISLSYDETGNVKQTSKLLSGRKEGFSPPEQSHINSLKIFSPTIDTYALGASLYFSLTGMVPPDSGSISAGFAGLAFPSDIDNNISAFLDFLVLKAMNIKSIDRFQDAHSFKNALMAGEADYTNALSEGEKLFDVGKWNEALSKFQKAYYWINTNDDLNRKIANCKRALQEEEKLAQNDLLFRDLIQKGAAYFASKNYLEAKNSFHKALKYKPEDSDTQQKIADCDTRLKEKTKLIADKVVTPSPVVPKINTHAETNDATKTGKKNGKHTFSWSVIIGVSIVIVIAILLLFPKKSDAPVEEVVYESVAEVTDEPAEEVIDEPVAIATPEPKQEASVPVENNSGNTASVSKEEQEKQKQAEINTTLRQADAAFNTKRWEEAYRLYKKISQLSPGNTTGYNKFLEKGKAMKAINDGVCDSNIKEHFEYAKKLNNTAEVRRALLDCN